MFRSLFTDESGFIVSAELVLVATILVIGLIVGMSEVQHAVVAELNDVADAIGSANQTYSYSGFTKHDGRWGWGGIHAHTAGSVFIDLQDACDLNQCMLACNPPTVEAPKYGTCAAAYGTSATTYGGGVHGAPAYGVPTPAVIEDGAAVPTTDDAADVPAATP